MKSYVRISVLKWSHILTKYAMWVMVTYLTDVWGLSITKSAAIVNVCTGVENLMQLPFAFLADEFVGKYFMLLLSSIAYTIGLGCLYMSTPPVLANYSGNCSEYKSECIGYTQEILFYTALALTAVGISGHAVSLDSFLEENTGGAFTDEEGESDNQACFWGLGGLLGIAFPVVAGITLLYINPWSIRFGIPALCTLVATLLFISGSRSYKTYCKPKGSPLKVVFRVFAASTSKIFLRIPSDDNELYGKDDKSSQKLPYPSLRMQVFRQGRNSMTTKSKQEQVMHTWTLCGVKEVEAVKKLIRIFPICVTFIISGVVISVGNTYFVEQANHLNRHVGRLVVPLTLFLANYEFSKTLTAIQYKISKPNQSESRTRAIELPIGTTYLVNIYIVISFIIAAAVEMRRLRTIRKHGLLDKPEERIPMSIFFLVPQFSFFGAADGVYKSSISHFFAVYAPLCMYKYQDFFQKGVMGLGTIGSVLSVYLVGRVSEMGGKPNWFQHTLNRSRLDRYYWTLAVLCAVNFVIYNLVLCFYDFERMHSEEPGEELSLKEEVSEEEQVSLEELPGELFEESTTIMDA